MTTGPRLHGDGFTMMELMAVMAVVAILALMALPSYQEKFVRDQIIEALPLGDVAKAPVQLAWSAAQVLPARNSDAGLPSADKIVSNLVRSVELQNGAIHITFGNRANSVLRDKVLTLRPAVVADAPIVPIAWICGNAPTPDKMTVKGENRTNVAPLYLPFRCRA